MHVKEPTSLLAKSREKSQWSGQTVETGSYTWVERPTGHSYEVNFSPPWQTRRLPTFKTYFTADSTQLLDKNRHQNVNFLDDF